MNILQLDCVPKIVFLGKYVLAPTLFYAAFFCVLTYPLIILFSSHFFADTGDGFQNVWNLWWVDKAILSLHTNPFFTTYLHYPHGISLIAHTLNPFNGMIALFLPGLSWVQKHNFIVVFSFVVGGATMFWLAYEVTHSYCGSLIAGYIFTFSQFHFSHAEGHLQLVSLEWIPAFILCWYRFIHTARLVYALLAALLLFFVILCDYYYFFYSIIAALLTTIWYGVVTKNVFFFLKKDSHFENLILFIIFTLLTSGVLVGSLVWLQLNDRLKGAHNPKEFSLDLLAAVIPGGHWRFATLTEFFWSRLPGNMHESSVSLGITVILVTIYIGFRLRDVARDNPSVVLWYGMGLIFFILALGPRLQVFGRPMNWIPLPYQLLSTWFPFLKLSGIPVRMIVMVTLSAAVICAIAVKTYTRNLTIGKSLLLIGWCVVLVIELWPKPLPASGVEVPEYVRVIQRLPADGALFDATTPSTLALYHQTIHQKPLALGYVARYPKSAWEKEQRITQAVRTGSYEILLKHYGIKYLVLPAEQIRDASGILSPLYATPNFGLYRIEASSFLER